MLNIVLFGAPGAGKGTQSRLLVERYDLLHISPGEIFRQEIAKKSALGKMLSSYIYEGQLVPESAVIKTVDAVLADHTNAKGFLFDGYPRSLDQAEALDIQLKSLGHTLDVVLHLEVSEGELHARIHSRKGIEGRQDDDKFQERLALYHTYAPPLLSYYKERELLVEVPGEGGVEEVDHRIQAALSSFLGNPSSD